MIKKIVTHNGIFHADEVSAIALLEIFTDEKYEIKRVPHNTPKEELREYDFAIDIGREFDGKKFFDHHQWSGGKSSAGLIWEYLGVAKDYPKLSRLIEMVDKQDTGRAKAKEFEYPNLIKLFNGNIERNDENFFKALEFAKMIINSIKKEEEDRLKAKKIIENSKEFENIPETLELKEFNPFWKKFINTKNNSDIKVVIWKDKDSYKAQVVPKEEDSFELGWRPFQKSNSMEFVHSAGFFAVAKDKETMKNFIQNYIKGGDYDKR
jgi:uncharacterized UPF0160 family protein